MKRLLDARVRRVVFCAGVGLLPLAGCTTDTGYSAGGSSGQVEAWIGPPTETYTPYRPARPAVPARSAIPESPVVSFPGPSTKPTVGSSASAARFAEQPIDDQPVVTSSALPIAGNQTAGELVTTPTPGYEPRAYEARLFEPHAVAPVVPSRLTRDQIIAWTEQGVRDEVIIDRVERSEMALRLSTADEMQLRRKGVSEDVIAAIKGTARR